MSDIATLEQVKEYLRYPNPSDAGPDDDILTILMESADEQIRRYCGEILSVTYTEWYPGGDTMIQLRHFPVASIQQVEENWGFYTYILTEQPGDSDPSDTSLWAYSLDYPNDGIITRRSVGNVVIPFVNPSGGGDNINVQYTTGVANIPGNVTHGWLDLIAFWWQNTQQRSTGPQTGMFETAQNAAPFIGVPNRIIEILQGAKRAPVIG